MEKSNPLNELLIDNAASMKLNLTSLAKIVGPYCLINKETKGFEILPALYSKSLTNDQKILFLLAASKARHSLLNVEESLSPTEIIKLNVMPTGSVKSSLKNLLDIGEIKSEKGRYTLPNYRLENLATMAEYLIP